MHIVITLCEDFYVGEEYWIGGGWRQQREYLIFKRSVPENSKWELFIRLREAYLIFNQNLKQLMDRAARESILKWKHFIRWTYLKLFILCSFKSPMRLWDFPALQDEIK